MAMTRFSGGVSLWCSKEGFDPFWRHQGFLVQYLYGVVKEGWTLPGNDKV